MGASDKERTLDQNLGFQHTERLHSVGHFEPGTTFGSLAT